jgi:hypothetical protein
MWVMISYDRTEDVYYGPFISEDAAAAFAEANKIMFFVLEPLISPFGATEAFGATPK